MKRTVPLSETRMALCASIAPIRASYLPDASQIEIFMRLDRWVLSGSLLLALAVSTGCKAKDAKAANSEDPDSTETRGSSVSLPVVGAPVRVGDLVLSVMTTGQVRSDAVSRLKAEVVGTVQDVLVVAGQSVTKGQPLVKFDPRPLDVAVREAEAAVEQAEVQYLDNIIPDSLVTGLAPTPERRRNAIARSGLAGAKARLERAQLDRERGVIVAPFDGVVDQVSVADGERVSVGQDIATVVNTARLRIEASVLEHDLGLIRVGGQAFVSTPAAPNAPINGRIEAVLPVVDSTTRAGRAIVRMTGAGARHAVPLRPGMYADVRLEASRLPNRTLVPAKAIIERDGRPLVFVVKDGRAQWVYVQPGRTNGLDTEILPDSTTREIPVKAGDTVLIEGHLTLTHDAPVKVVTAAETSER